MEMTRVLQIIIRELYGLNKIMGSKGFEKAKLHIHLSASFLLCSLGPLLVTKCSDWLAWNCFQSASSFSFILFTGRY